MNSSGPTNEKHSNDPPLQRNGTTKYSDSNGASGNDNYTTVSECTTTSHHPISVLPTTPSDVNLCVNCKVLL